MDTERDRDGSPGAAEGPEQRSGNPEEADGAKAGKAPEIGGRDGPDPTRYGDWEKNGRCIDF